MEHQVTQIINRPAKSVKCSSDPKLANRMFLKISRGEKVKFWMEFEEHGKKKGNRAEVILDVFYEDLDLITWFTEFIKGK